LVEVLGVRITAIVLICPIEGGRSTNVRVRHDCYCWWASDERKWEVRGGRIKENKKNKGEEQEKEEEEDRARY